MLQTSQSLYIYFMWAIKQKW